MLWSLRFGPFVTENVVACVGRFYFYLHCNCIHSCNHIICIYGSASDFVFNTCLLISTRSIPEWRCTVGLIVLRYGFNSGVDPSCSSISCVVSLASPTSELPGFNCTGRGDEGNINHFILHRQQLGTQGGRDFFFFFFFF